MTRQIKTKDKIVSKVKFQERKSNNMKLFSFKILNNIFFSIQLKYLAIEIKIVFKN